MNMIPFQLSVDNRVTLRLLAPRGCDTLSKDHLKRIVLISIQHFLPVKGTRVI